MPEMYCPQCGRQLELDSGEIRFCRYCGFSLVDTKEALHGYSEQKRMGFSIVTWSYALLLIVTLLLHGQYVSLETTWVYWLMSVLIVASVSFFCSAAVSALKPSLFTKAKPADKTKLEPGGVRTIAIGSNEVQATSLLPDAQERVAMYGMRSEREVAMDARSVVEGTTRKLDDN